MNNFRSRCQVGILLRDVSTIGVGGVAQLFFEAATIKDMQEAQQWARLEGYKFLVLGRGSNCLFSDEGFQGLVVRNRIEGCVEEDGLFYVGGGSSFSALGVTVAKQQRGGLEYAAGIPASVGGAVVMNAGAHGQQIADTLEFVDIIDSSGTLKRVSKKELTFGYRFCSLQHTGGIVVGAGFCCPRDEKAREKQLSMLAARTTTQPCHEKTAGCVFKNPPGMSAGKLIDEAGLKGKAIGGAYISPIHANFIVNGGQSTAKDILALIEHVQTCVAERTGIWLESEIRLIR